MTGPAWTCGHGVPLGQYCARCAGGGVRRRLAAGALTLTLRALLAVLPERHTECPDRGCGGGAR